MTTLRDQGTCGRAKRGTYCSPRRVTLMACTPEELAEIRRRNGRMSRGPLTDAGGSISRRTGRDVMQRSHVVSTTLFIRDEREARLFFRDFPGSAATFVRCFKELEATRERDAK